MNRLALAAFAALLSAPCLAQQKKASADPTRLDSDLVWHVRDRIIQRGRPARMMDLSVEDCLSDAVGTHEETLTACLDADQVVPKSDGIAAPAVLRYVIRDLTVTVQDGPDHYIFVISAQNKVTNAVHLDENGVPSSADVSVPKVREVLLRSLRIATSLPLIEA